jgi:hypothetical protein
MKWEYKMVHMGFAPTADADVYEERLHAGVHALNELGEQGWELVDFLEHQVTRDTFKCHAVLKRPRPES